jgi:hypothetical protein
MRARALFSIVLVAAGCNRDANITGVRNDHPSSLVSSVTGPGFLVAPAAIAPAGLAACWPGDGNALDIANGNAGTVFGAVSFAAGKFGQAFSFDALGGDVQVPAGARLDVGAGDGLTYSAWIFPKGNVFGPTVGSGPIMEFENGAQLWSHYQFSESAAPTGLFDNMAESQNASHIVQVAGVVTQNAWNHVAATYSRTSGDLNLYANGVLVAGANVGSFVPNTASIFHIGSRAAGSFGTTQFTFNGLIDEVQIYGRALTGDEVASLALATVSLCAPQPRQLGIATQPGGAESGVAFATQPVVELRSASDALATDAAVAVTATIATGTGTLSGTTTVIAVHGVATFTDLKIAGSGNYTLGFTAAGLTSATSASFAVVQVVRSLVLTTQPGNSMSGMHVVPAPVVVLRDAAGLTVASASDVVTASIASGTGALSGTTAVNAAAGVATFPDLVITGTGSFTLRFALTGGSPSATSAPFGVVAPLPPPFKWRGFFEPIDNAPRINEANAGQSIPIKFSLGGDQGRAIFAAGYPASRQVSCRDGSAIGPLELINVTTRDGTTARYDDGQYTIVWKTDKSWANTCRTLYVKLTDGSMHIATFNFRGEHER